MNRFDELRNKKQEVFQEMTEKTNRLTKIANESRRVSTIARDSKIIIEDIDREFSKCTKLNKLDISFLFVAIALQVARQVIFTNDAFRFEKDSDADKFIKKPLKNIIKPEEKISKILFSPVPYDAFRKTPNMALVNTGISGANHRNTVLGHDPLLGWIFGTMNIMTGTITKKNLILESYEVENNLISGNTNFAFIVNASIRNIEADYRILIASIVAQAIHIGSDAFTKMGLPIPILNNVAPDLTSKLQSESFRIDLYSVSRGVILSTLINRIIASVHGLFYDKNKYESRDMYEVKTRKILSYSNIIASTSNIIHVAITKDFKKLDVGGLIVSIYRFITDYKFIRAIKEEFLREKFYNIVQGEEYDF